MLLLLKLYKIPTFHFLFEINNLKFEIFKQKMKSTKMKSKSKQTSTSRYNSHFSKCFTIRKEKKIAGNIINIVNAAVVACSH